MRKLRLVKTIKEDPLANLHQGTVIHENNPLAFLITTDIQDEHIEEYSNELNLNFSNNYYQNQIYNIVTTNNKSITHKESTLILFASAMKILNVSKDAKLLLGQQSSFHAELSHALKISPWNYSIESRLKNWINQDQGCISLEVPIQLYLKQAEFNIESTDSIQVINTKTISKLQKEWIGIDNKSNLKRAA